MGSHNINKLVARIAFKSRSVTNWTPKYSGELTEVPSSCQVDFLLEPGRREVKAGLASHSAIKTHAI